MKLHEVPNNSKIIQGDCLEKLKELDSNSVDSIVTDPPYGLEFMGKEWDKCTRNLMNPTSEADIKRKKKYGKNYSGRCSNLPDFSKNKPRQQQEWHYQWAKECLRVLKPGGHLLSFGGSRTYHRMACAIEDAGFEIRDQIMWVYGSGFPKSHNIGKSVDKLQGNEREDLGEHPNPAGSKGNTFPLEQSCRLTKGTSEYEGWGTALKPAHEPICMARKPLSEKTIAENVLKWGTGGINIDESRVGTEKWTHKAGKTSPYGNPNIWDTKGNTPDIDREGNGRFPANLIHDGSDEVVREFPDTKPNKATEYNWDESNNDNPVRITKNIKSGIHFGDSGSAARFFYVAKASKSERNAGLEGFEEIKKGSNFGNNGARPHTKPDYKYEGTTRNNHPTVKPIKLMQYLVRLITPKGGTVLDPFMGSGSTGIACKKEGFEFIGIEKEAEYCKIAEARIKNTQKPDPILFRK